MSPGCKDEWLINTLSSWWLNQPIWKICWSNWIISPMLGVKIKKKETTTQFYSYTLMETNISPSKTLLSRWFSPFPFAGICNRFLEGTYFIHRNGSPLGPCVVSFLVCRTGQYKHLGWMFLTTRNETCSKPCSGEYLLSYDFNDPQESLYLQGTNVSSIEPQW